MLASVHAIDSVIVHELCHISEPNHGERFWRRVKNFSLIILMRGRA